MRIKLSTPLARSKTVNLSIWSTRSLDRNSKRRVKTPTPLSKSLTSKHGPSAQECTTICILCGARSTSKSMRTVKQLTYLIVSLSTKSFRNSASLVWSSPWHMVTLSSAKMSSMRSLGARPCSSRSSSKAARSVRKLAICLTNSSKMSSSRSQ